MLLSHAYRDDGLHERDIGLVACVRLGEIPLEYLHSKVM